jgi:beta propeller repeat protein
MDTTTQGGCPVEKRCAVRNSLRATRIALVVAALASTAVVATYAATTYRTGVVLSGADAQPTGTPDTDGSFVVWRDGRNDRGDIYGRDLFGGSERVICDAPGVQWQPHVSGDTVVWVDERTNYQYGGEDYQVFCYDRSTKQELSIPSAYATNPEVDDKKIVWEEVVSGGSEPSVVKLFDLTSQQGSLVANNAMDPAISGDRVVFLRYHRRAEDQALISNVYLQDLTSADEAAAIEATDTPQESPDIHGDLVAWVQQHQTDEDLNGLYLMDLASGETRRVFESPAPISGVSVGSRLLTWTAWSGAGVDGEPYEGGLYALDLITGEMFTFAGFDEGPFVGDITATGGDVIVWDDWNEEKNNHSIRALTVGPIDDHASPITSLLGLDGKELESDEQLRLSARDPGVFYSGVKATRYALDDSGVRAYSKPLTLELGEHTIAYSSVDASGNAETTKTASFLVVEAESGTTTETPTLPATGGSALWVLAAAAVAAIMGVGLRFVGGRG